MASRFDIYSIKLIGMFMLKLLGLFLITRTQSNSESFLTSKYLNIG